MSRWKMVGLIFLSIALIMTSKVSADDNFERWGSPRDYQHVMLNGEFIDGFLGLPVNEIFAYSYDAAQNEWKQVPLQIDERDDSSHVFVPNPNKILDNRDLILFMARDMGDQVEGDYVWIEDESSRSSSRFEITVGDATEPGAQAYLYLYHSTTLQDTVQGYMQYTEAETGKGNDIITAAGYEERHTDLGIPNSLMIPEANGGSNIDLIDRLKIRLKAFAFIVELDETEEFLRDPTIEYRTGKVRITRRISFVAYLFGQPTLPFTIPMTYYPYSATAELSFNLSVSGVDVSHFRQSIDLSPEARGMMFYNNFNLDVLIDGLPDEVDKSLVFETEGRNNWQLVTGESGSMLNMYMLASEGDTRLYFYDDSSGGTGDGRLDTGDMQSWGDIGVLKTGESLKSLGVPYTTYYLPRNQDPAAMPGFEEKYRTPFVIVRKSQTYQEPIHVLVSAPNITAPALSNFNLPIQIDDVTGLGIKSVKMSLSYDTSLLQFSGVTTANTIATAWVNYDVTLKDNGIDIEISGNTSLSGSGDFVFIEYKAIGIVGDTTTIDIHDVRFNVLSVAAETANGFVKITSPIVVLTLPDTTAASLDTILVPVKISEVAGKEVKSVNMMISFDPTVLDAVSISTTNTLVSGWTNIAFNDFSNRSHIIMSGSNALSEDGTLINIKYAVNGADGSGTTLAFMTAIFNTGSPVVVKNNGYLSVEGVIPVELASFAATEVKGDVILNWQTLSESNNYGFQIERKNSEGVTWSSIGFVKGHGTSQTPREYTYIDRPAAASTYFYRLKQVDFDGSFAYSPEAKVTLSVPDNFMLAQNYPNPFNPVTHIDYELPDIGGSEMQVELAIYNLLGEKIRTLVSEKRSAGYHSETWDGKDDSGNRVTTGIYVYRLKAGEFVSTRRMAYLK
ncbi:T9SS type A sorting domain-containing protein [candidate division KSB1 bacterium]|nr:T9SS type A sorting domain-containing protein [candidate division KSB1 bacterium]